MQIDRRILRKPIYLDQHDGTCAYPIVPPIREHHKQSKYTVTMTTNPLARSPTTARSTEDFCGSPSERPSPLQFEEKLPLNRKGTAASDQAVYTVSQRVDVDTKHEVRNKDSYMRRASAPISSPNQPPPKPMEISTRFTVPLKENAEIEDVIGYDSNKDSDQEVDSAGFQEISDRSKSGRRKDRGARVCTKCGKSTIYVTKGVDGSYTVPRRRRRGTMEVSAGGVNMDTEEQYTDEDIDIGGMNLDGMLISGINSTFIGNDQDGIAWGESSDDIEEWADDVGETELVDYAKVCSLLGGSDDSDSDSESEVGESVSEAYEGDGTESVDSLLPSTYEQENASSESDAGEDLGDGWSDLSSGESSGSSDSESECGCVSSADSTDERETSSSDELEDDNLMKKSGNHAVSQSSETPSKARSIPQMAINEFLDAVASSGSILPPADNANTTPTKYIKDSLSSGSNSTPTPGYGLVIDAAGNIIPSAMRKSSIESPLRSSSWADQTREGPFLSTKADSPSRSRPASPPQRDGLSPSPPLVFYAYSGKGHAHRQRQHTDRHAPHGAFMHTHGHDHGTEGRRHRPFVHPQRGGGTGTGLRAQPHTHTHTYKPNSARPQTYPHTPALLQNHTLGPSYTYTHTHDTTQQHLSRSQSQHVGTRKLTREEISAIDQQMRARVPARYDQQPACLGAVKFSESVMMVPLPENDDTRNARMGTWVQDAMRERRAEMMANANAAAAAFQQQQQTDSSPDIFSSSQHTLSFDFAATAPANSPENNGTTSSPTSSTSTPSVSSSTSTPSASRQVSATKAKSGADTSDYAQKQAPVVFLQHVRRPRAGSKNTTTNINTKINTNISTNTITNTTPEQDSSVPTGTSDMLDTDTDTDNDVPDFMTEYADLASCSHDTPSHIDLGAVDVDLSRVNIGSGVAVGVGVGMGSTYEEAYAAAVRAGNIAVQKNAQAQQATAHNQAISVSRTGTKLAHSQKDARGGSDGRDKGSGYPGPVCGVNHCCAICRPEFSFVEWIFEVERREKLWLHEHKLCDCYQAKGLVVWPEDG
ncbi:hypothetical protein SARC_12733 [Sphaeroforma arctica JP610]|uniref:Uncharacterized protein n=1 Tax=Sphaeroforma arctica JP610 TaxID=667725 RepID=A0A0L0FFA2_9EUKA|nr:hypothetical protein SARC_12733 [Sphaeroforma arctica JP610]KNC74728.1 hypothetical protein SARC_12733 [Sphaeroforma arctica JP610]|eukprot:XP_014148630.1 hypothetical protein SARC_12733 [Sphaeroforma arctica JP610]